MITLYNLSALHGAPCLACPALDAVFQNLSVVRPCLEAEQVPIEPLPCPFSSNFCTKRTT
ncbi:MAG: hypothetical protein JWQ08_463 [Deinococcus sp.]|jgi:hypothetical protein|nr:hypothetical protein [Deinococcus sp.]